MTTGVPAQVRSINLKNFRKEFVHIMYALPRVGES